MNRSPYRDPRIWCLAVAETLVWAGLYYFFPAMLLRWEADFGWSKTEITLAATLSLLVSAVVAPRVGVLIDKDRGRGVLVGSAVLGGALLACLPLVQTPVQFIAVWLGIGVAMGGCLYEPCFAFLTHKRGLDAQRAITLITLVAGFAGTVSFPLANGIAALDGWRTAALVFAGLVVFVAAPLFWFGASARDDDAFDRPVGAPATDRSPLQAALTKPVFWLLAIGFSTIALNHGMVVNHLLPMLDERGVSDTAAVFAISLIGPMQVAGRLLMMAVERYVGMVFVCGATFLFMALAGAVLGAAAALPGLIYLFVLLQGSGYGVTSITRPIVTAILLGRAGFGAISGALALPFVTATALAPSIGSVIWHAGGYDAVIASMVGMILFGFICFLIAARLARRVG